MQKEYEEMKPKIYEQINDMKIDSYDKYIDKMLNKANFKYATNGEASVDSILDFSVVGPLKMGAEAVDGNNFITGEEYSDGQRVFTPGLRTVKRVS
jgi:hypothetical protein